MQETEVQRIQSIEGTLPHAEATSGTMDNTEGGHAPPMRAPEPHVPLRKASARQLRSRQSAPRPLFDTTSAVHAHQLRGFNPSPVQQVTPGMADVIASSEHAFAGKEDHRRRPFHLPLREQATKIQAETLPKNEGGQVGQRRVTPRSRPPSSPLVPPPSSPPAKQRNLRNHRSLGDGLKGLRSRFSQHQTKSRRSSPDPLGPPPPNMADPEIRDSFRSAMTSNSSFLHASSIYTDHSSWTGNSSISDFVNVYPNWPGMEEEAKHSSVTLEAPRPGSATTDTARPISMTVEDAIGMYEEGFESTKQSLDAERESCFEAPMKQHSDLGNSKPISGDAQTCLQDVRPASQPADEAEVSKQKKSAHRRSQSANFLLLAQSYHAGSPKPGRTPSQQKRTFSKILAPKANKVTRPTSKASHELTVPRDRYGFKKTSHYITAEQYDDWNVQYSEHLDRRMKKWQVLMDSYGLSTDKAFRFPPKSDKIKRYVRKGIPPDLRGAAWFWYAGGPSRLAKEQDLYHSLLEQIREGKLSENDREHIERDLNRTYPDNIRFKPDPTTILDAQSGAGGGVDDHASGKKKNRRITIEPETPILCALRRVLQAFAIRNPSIGYCQSLNFIAGLLLLFLDEDEEKAFILLEIVTSVHLPGTHGIALEGANIDIAVLMSCIKDSLPVVWSKLDDKGRNDSSSAGMLTSPQALRLPTVSLATTAWFMSLFVGTLPIEAVLRVWDCLFFEGSKTLFRVALAVFKLGEPQIAAVADPMEVFQLVQTIPRSVLDINGLLELCFKRRGGFAHVSQELIERRRAERRQALKEGGVDVDEEGKVWKRWRAKSRT